MKNYLKLNMTENTYTCPMHPEVVSSKKGKCPKCGMSLVPSSETQHSHNIPAGHSHVSGDGPDHGSMMASPEAASDFLRRFFIVTALLVPLAVFSEPAVMFLGVPDFALRPYLEFSIATIIFYFGLVFFRHAKMEIAMRQYGMMTLVSLGVGSGYIFSAISTFAPALGVEFYLEVSTLVWVLLFGHFLEAKSSTAAGDALQEVAKLLPKLAHKIVSSRVIPDRDPESIQIKDVPITSLKSGDVVLIKPGEKSPADGIIIKGSSSFNEAHITGESKPVGKGVKDEVIAGAISIDGSVEVRLVRVGESSTIGQIQALIASAKQTKPSVQRLADRASKWLTFTALGVSITTLIIWSAVIGEPFVFAATLAITVLVIACPHALGLAIPTVSTIATRLAVKNGVFIKDMAKIEVIKNADYVVFDKTGTLTKGEPEMIEFEFMENLSEVFKELNWKTPSSLDPKKYISSLILTVERQSSHPIALAITKRLEKQSNTKELKFKNFKNIAGKGIQIEIDEHKVLIGTKDFVISGKTMLCSNLDSLTQTWAGKGQSVVYISVDSKHLASLSVADAIRNESKVAVAMLHKLGVKVAMLTGDNKAVADSVATELGIDTVFAEVLPEDKYKHIKSLQDKGNIVLMAGDGVNDAPALTQANAGVAIGTGTDVAVEAGDVVLTQSNPEHIVRLIVLSRKVYRKMIENLVYALGYNIIAIPAAAGLFIPLGFHLTPAVGALLMSLSSVLVVINALTLKSAKLET
jgi:Cu2+-exporting ATPase